MAFSSDEVIRARRSLGIGGRLEAGRYEGGEWCQALGSERMASPIHEISPPLEI